MEKILYSVKEVAELFLTNKNKIYELIHDEKLSRIEILGKTKITATEIERFIAENSIRTKQ